MGRVRFIIGLILLCWLGVPARADSSSADRPHVHVALVVVPQALNRGEAAEAGLYFKIDPGWHVYWKNPGDAGEPPHIMLVPRLNDFGWMEFSRAKEAIAEGKACVAHALPMLARYK